MCKGRFVVYATLICVLLSGCGQKTESDEVAVTTESLVEVSDTDENAIISSEVIETGYLERMAEEDLHKLTIEVLEENGKDSSVVTGDKQIEEVLFDAPEGFFEDPELNMPNLYVTERYPIDVSNVYYMESALDPAMQLLTEQQFLDNTEHSLWEEFGVEIPVTIESFESITIDTIPGFRILCHYEIDGVALTQLVYALNGDKNYTITYTMTDEYERMEAFEKSAETIHIVMK